MGYYKSIKDKIQHTAHEVEEHLSSNDQRPKDSQGHTHPLMIYLQNKRLAAFQGESLYNVGKYFFRSMFMENLNTRASSLSFNFFLALFPAIIFLAGLNAISTDYIEAARIDGASEGQIFRKILFPLLAPSMTIITVLTFIGAFEWFDLPYLGWI